MTRPILTGFSNPRFRRGLDGAQRVGVALGATLKAQVRAHPYQTLLVAGGMGYALAGGLLGPVASRLLRGGARFLILPLMAAVGESVAEIAGELLAERDQRRP